MATILPSEAPQEGEPKLPNKADKLINELNSEVGTEKDLIDRVEKQVKEGLAAAKEKMEKDNVTPEELQKICKSEADVKINEAEKLVSADANKIVSGELVRVTKYKNGIPELMVEGSLEQVIGAYNEIA